MEQDKWSTYPKDYRKDEINYIVDNCKSGDSVLIISFPGCGKSTLLRYLSENPIFVEKNPTLKFVYVDLNQLPRFEPSQLYKLILRELCKVSNLKVTYTSGDEELALLDQIREALTRLSEDAERVAIILDRFDKVIASLPPETFNTLKSLRDDFKHFLIFVVATPTDPLNLSPLSKIVSFYKLVIPSVLYVKPFNEENCRVMIREFAKRRNRKLTKEQETKIRQVSGCHPTLAKSIIQALEEDTKLTIDVPTISQLSSVNICLTEITESLNLSDLRTALDIAMERTPSDTNSLRTLLNLGIAVPMQGNKYRLFSPVFSEHLKTSEIPKHHKVNIANLQKVFDLDENRNTVVKKGKDLSQILTKQETELMKYLIVNQGRVCKRDEIASVIWGQNSMEGITNEAIDQVVSRLRSKIEENEKPEYLITLRGIGFKFDNPIS